MSFQENLAALMANQKTTMHLEAGPAVPSDAQLDVALAKLDALMNGYTYTPEDEVPPFMAEPLAAMRAVLRELLAGGVPA
jgi:hypothetical protein